MPDLEALRARIRSVKRQPSGASCPDTYGAGQCPDKPGQGGGVCPDGVRLPYFVQDWPSCARKEFYDLLHDMNEWCHKLNRSKSNNSTTCELLIRRLNSGRRTS